MDRLLLLIVMEVGDNDQAEAEGGEDDDAKNDINVACLRWKRFILFLVFVILNGATLSVLLLVCCDMVFRCWGENNSKDPAVEVEDKKTGDFLVLVMIVLAVALATVTNIRLLWILTEYWKWIL